MNQGIGVLEKINQRLERIENQLQELFKLIRERTIESEYLTVADVAKLLKKETRTIHKWLDAGVLTRRKIGGAVLIEKAEIDAVLRGEKSIEV